MKALVTGGSGFVGAAVVRALAAAGHEVRVLVRPQSPRSNLEGLDVELVAGDLRDAASLARALRGRDALFHVAADYRLWARDRTVLHEVNVEGTRRLMHAALDAGVERVVHTSSVATLRLDDRGLPVDETAWATLDDMIGDYKRSKFLAEELVREMVASAGLPAVIVNPSTPIGPGDVRPTPTGRFIRDAALGRVPAYVDTGLNFVHVDDVALGHLLAFERGRIGERYILGGEDLTLRQVLERIAALTGRPAPRIRLPRRAIFPVAWAAQGWARLTGGGEPLVTVDGLRMAGKKMFFASDRARGELGYAPRPADEAIADAVRWFRARAGAA